MPRVDLKGVRTTFEIVPDGDYNGIFSKFENGKTQKGDDKVTHTYTITDDGEYKGRKLFRTFTFTEAALWAWKAECIALGADPDALEQDEMDSDEILKELLNNDVKMRVKHHEVPWPDESDPRPPRVFNDVELIADNSW